MDLDGIWINIFIAGLLFGIIPGLVIFFIANGKRNIYYIELRSFKNKWIEAGNDEVSYSKKLKNWINEKGYQLPPRIGPGWNLAIIVGLLFGIIPGLVFYLLLTAKEISITRN